MNQEQMLKMQGWSNENIEKLRLISENPEAYSHAMKTKDLSGALAMCQPQEKPQINLNDWFLAFTQERPSYAESLSIALTEFAEFVQSKVEKKAP